MGSIRMVLLVVILCSFSSCQTEELRKDIQKDIEQFAARPSEVYLDDQPYVTDDTGNSEVPWVKVWDDEFDGDELDDSKWNVSVSTKSRAPRRGINQDIRDWRWTEDHVALNGQGQLVLSVEKVGKHRMECGSVQSKGKYMQRYGYFEVRMKVAETKKGSHSAFWLMSPDQGLVDGTANDGAEIDVFESAWIGDYTKSVIHIDGYGKHHKANTKRYTTPGIHDGYHIFGLDWSKDRMDIYYDGKRKVTYSGDWVPNVEEFLWLSVGASFGDGNFQAQGKGVLTNAMVDYIRVYKKVYFRLVNKQTGKTFRIAGPADDALISQSPHKAMGGWTQWAIKKTEKEYFYFVNKSSNKYMRPLTHNNGARIVQKNTSFNGAWTQWEMVDAGGGYVYIVNRETRTPIRPEGYVDNAPLVLTSRADVSDWTKWKVQTVKE